MIRKLGLSIFFSLVFVSSILSQEIFNLKGKNIILISHKVAYAGYNTSKIACGGRFNIQNHYEYVYNDCFGNFYNVKSLKKNKFTKKNLYTGDVFGKPVYVSDVYIINPESKEKKTLLMLLNTESDTLVLHMPLYLSSNAYFSNVDPNDIGLSYYDYDQISQLSKQIKDKRFYRKNKNELYRFDDIIMINGLFTIKYYDNNNVLWKYTICVNTTEEWKYNHKWWINGSKLDDFLSSIVLEEDLITECKLKYDSAYINTLRNKYLYKEIYLDTGAKQDFFICSDLSIKNIGTDSPLYNYVLTLHNNKDTIDFPIQKGLEHIVFADEYREKQKIKEEKRLKKEAERRAKIEKEKREYKTSLITRFGEDNARTILNKKVKIGFTKEMCIEAWGRPYDINRTITAYCVYEQWVYGIGCYLYFEGDILKTIQN